MNRCSIFTACLALVSLFTPHTANAEVSLAADLVAGVESSSATPVGRVSQGVLMVAKTATGETNLLIAREPSGSIASITTLTKTSGVVAYAANGDFFSIPAGFAGAGTNWFSDGTPEGTVPVPFSKGNIFQKNGTEVFYSYGDKYAIGRYNMATGLNEPSFCRSGDVQIEAIVEGIPLGMNGGYVYQWDLQNKRWLTLDSISSFDVPYVHSGPNHDKFFIAVVQHATPDDLYSYYVYRVRPLWGVSFASVLAISEQFVSINRTVRREGNVDYWAFTASPGGQEEYYNIERYVESDSSYDDAGFGYFYVGVPNTRRGSHGFAARSGRLYSFSVFNQETPHEQLTSGQEAITVRSLRVVGDTLLIFGSTPSRGAEVWSTPVDSCPNDSAKLYGGSCGCGVADTDFDRDGTPDCLDLCPSDATKLAAGICGCGTPDVDPDNDGTMSCVDLCPLNPSKVSPGACGCNAAETDSDGDGTPDCKDTCPTDTTKASPGACGCGIVDVDTDRDGTMDCNDQCPASALKQWAGACGCNVADTDTDGDQFPDCIDVCPSDRTKLSAGSCGCGVSEQDTDGDFAPDCVDQCPADKNKTAPGKTGCGVSDLDTDGDNTPDAHDQCPVDYRKTSPGTCGCNASDYDSDSDGHPDCVDECSSDRNKDKAGVCGCGVFDTDSDKDGTADCFDLCPSEPALTSPVNGSCTVTTATVDLCPSDPLKLLPGICGCGASDSYMNGMGVVQCVRPRSVPVVSAPTVVARYAGKSGRMAIAMTMVQDATYEVEVKRLDKKGAKPVTKIFRRPAATITGLAAKSRWSVRYRVTTGGTSSEWSAPTRVKVK
jgi:hypothetical protein